jgi:hypothetical protein
LATLGDAILAETSCFSFSLTEQLAQTFFDVHCVRVSIKLSFGTKTNEKQLTMTNIANKVAEIFCT